MKNSFLLFFFFFLLHFHVIETHEESENEVEKNQPLLAASIVIHFIGVVAAIATGKILQRYQVHPLIISLFQTKILIFLVSYALGLLGSILLLAYGSSLISCLLFNYGRIVGSMSFMTFTVILAWLRYYVTNQISKKKVTLFENHPKSLISKNCEKNRKHLLSLQLSSGYLLSV